jgi:hypothetical protein
MANDGARYGWWAATALVVALACLPARLDAGDASTSAAEKKEEEKPKEPPLKFSAWCAFRDLSDDRRPPKEDPTKDETRMASRIWSGFARRGHWANIILELKNTTEDREFAGNASIHFDPVRAGETATPVYQTDYRQDFRLGPQTVQQYSFSVLCPEGGWSGKTVDIEIVANGRSYGPRLVQLHDLDAAREDFIVVVSESSGAFRHLASKKRNIEDESRGHDRKVAVVEPAELPSRWHDLMLANLIVLDGPPRERLSDAQWGALKSYVQAGGHVLITAGKDPARLKGPVEELAGITVREMTELDRLDGGESSELNLIPRTDDWRLPLVDVSVSPKGNPTVRYNKASQKVEMSRRNYGPGSVTFLPFSLSDTKLETWPGRARIPLNILEYGRGRRLFDVAADDTEWDPDDPTDTDLTAPRGRQWSPYQQRPPRPPNPVMQFRYALDESFSKDTPVDPRKQNDVLGFVLLYLLCVVPGNYFIFGWLRRREVAWLAVPAWAMTFAVLAYVVGFMGRTGQLTVNEVAVIEAGPGQGTAMARTFLGVYAPWRDYYRMTFPAQPQTDESLFQPHAAPNHLINISRLQTRNLDVPPLHLVDGDEGLRVEQLLVQARSTRQLEIMHSARLGDGLDLSVRQSLDGGGSGLYDIDVANNTGFTLYHPVFILEDKAVALGTTPDNTLPPGAARKIERLSLAQEKEHDPGKLFFDRTIVLPTTRGDHVRARARALTEFVRQQVKKYPQGVVCAWADNPRGFLPVTVGWGRRDGVEPKLEGLSLLLVPVAIRSDLSRDTGTQSFPLVWGPNYDCQTDRGSWYEWKADASLGQGQIEGLAEGTVGTHLRVSLPQNYRSYTYAGLRLQLRFRLDARLPQIATPPPPPPRNTRQPPKAVVTPPQAPVQALDGELKVEVRKRDGKGLASWEEVHSELVTGLQNGKPFGPAVISMPWSDYAAVTGNAMTVRVSFKPSVTRRGPFTLRLTDAKCAAERP